jgi:hypothetical protein
MIELSIPRRRFDWSKPAVRDASALLFFFLVSGLLFF